jgi:hypothetical protein
VVVLARPDDAATGSGGVNTVLKHWPILAAVIAGSVAYGGLQNKVDSHEGKLSVITQMAVDIAVIKSRLDWLVERERQKEARTLRK